MPIMQDEEGRIISVDRHEDRGVILPEMEPVSVNAGPQRQDMPGPSENPPEGDVSAKEAGAIIQESDVGGADRRSRTAKAEETKREMSDQERGAKARQRAEARKARANQPKPVENKDASPQQPDRAQSQNVDLSGGVRGQDQDDALRGGVDTMKSPQERRAAGSGDEPTFANRDLSRSEAQERGEAMK